MRRPTSALSAAVLGTALTATTLMAQQQTPPSADGRGTPAPSAPTNPARGARYLLRNGWDYLSYRDFDRALALFREAEKRKDDLTDAERQKLAQGIEKAKGALRDAAGDLPPAMHVARRASARTPGALAIAAEPAATAEAPKPGTLDQIELPPIDSQPRTAPEPEPAPAPAPAAESDLAELPPLPSSVTPGQAPPPAADPASVPLPPPTELDAPPLPATLPPVEADPTAAPTDRALMPSSNAEPAALPVPANLTAEPPAALPEPPPIGAPTAAEPAPAPAAEELPALPPLPIESAPRPDAPAPAASRAVRAVAAPEPQPQPELQPQPPRPSMLPAPAREASRSADSLMPQRDTNLPPSTLSPELRREVDRIAQRDEEQLRRPPVPNRPPAPGESPDAPAYNGAPSSRLEISRAPSPTEARPIRAIPVPEEFTPLPPRQWQPNRKYWAAAATCHMPLYFQDAALERYGYTSEQHVGPIGRYLTYPIDDPTQSNQRNQLVQPFFSMGLFAAQIALLPYNLIMDPPWESEYDLGYYRPGDRVPTDVYYLPLHGVGPPLRGKNY